MSFNQPQFNLPQTLKKFSLSSFRLKWKDISRFQQVLPNLEILKLHNHAVSDEIWDMDDGAFPKLRFLKLEMLNVKRWIATAENFPCLQNLVIKDCIQLEEIPSSLGDICALEKIEVSCCSHSASESAKQIQQEQVENYGNDLLKVYI